MLDEWCEEVGRDPSDIERTVAIMETEATKVAEYVAAGADHVIMMSGPPYDLDGLQAMINQRDAMN